MPPNDLFVGPTDFSYYNKRFKTLYGTYEFTLVHLHYKIEN